jgi:hypothetical protein
MTYHRRRTRVAVAEIDAAILAWMRDEGPMPPEIAYFLDDAEIRALWDAEKDDIIAEWAQAHPGTRPSCWWRFETHEPRKRLGGRGTPCHSRLSHVAEYQFGIPASFVSDWWINVRHVDVERFGRDDPPTFESQAAYLKRHHLFQRGERPQLPANAMKPEKLPHEFWPPITEAG